MMRPLTLLTLIVFSLVLAQPGLARDTDLARSSYHRALAAYLHEDFQDALTAADAAIMHDSRFTPALALRARIASALADPARMAEDCAQVLARRRPRSAEELIARGSAHLLKGAADEALSDFTVALQAEKSPEAFAARARAWRAKGDFAAEAADLDQAIQGNPQALYYHNRAHAYFDMGQDDKAVADLFSALRLNKGASISFALLGTVMAHKGDAVRAAKAYDKALALNPEYTYAYLGRAALRLAHGNSEAAFKDFGEAVRVGPRDYSAWFNRAEAYWRLGRRDEALADYRKVLSSNLDDARFAMAVADRFAGQLLWSEAIEAYTKAAALSRGAAPLVSRARAWEALKDAKAAMRDLDAAVKAEPASAAAWSARGLLELELGQEEQALADLSHAVKLDPKAPGVRVARGRFYARLGKSALALDDFNAALASDPKLADAYNNRGALYANALNDSDKALSDIVAAVTLEPGNFDFQFNLGMLRMRARLYHKAIEAFTTALNLKGPPSRILQARAQARAKIGEHAGALRDIQVAIEKDSRNPAVYDTLGGIRMAGHDYEAAVGAFNQALHYDEDFVPALIHRGQAEGGLGSWQEALKDFSRAARLNSASRDAWTGLCTARRLGQKYETAVKDCARALTVDASYGPAYLQRGLAYLRLHETNRAIADIDSAYQFGVHRAEGLLGQSYGHALAKQYREADRAYWAAMALDPSARTFQAGFGAPRGEADDYFTAVADIAPLMAADVTDPYAFILRADALHSAGHYDKAIGEYTHAMEIDGTVVEAYLGRGSCLLAQEAFDAAQQDFLRAIELDPTNAHAHLRLATVLTTRRNYKGALAEIMAAIKIDLKGPEAYLRAGHAYYFQGAYQRALENYLVAAKYDPSLAAAYNGVGMANLALRKYPEALENFSRAIELGPSVDRYYRNRAATYMDMHQFLDAATEFKSASQVNTDPSSADEYQKLIKAAESQAGPGKT